MADAYEALRTEVRRVMGEFGPDYFRTLDAERTFPEAFFTKMGELGFFGALLPEEYGGDDAGYAAGSVIIEEINRAGGDATTINAQMSICGTLLRDGTDEQKARYLPGVADGSIRFLSVAATEADSGADMSDLESTARRDGDDWLLDAKKIFISLAEHTRVVLLLVMAEEGPTVFLLDLDEVGASVEIRPEPMVVNRMTTVFFVDELRLPDSARIGPAGQGLACLSKGFAPRRVFAAAECVGNARFLLDRSLEHARTRETFGRKIGSNQGVQYPLAQAHTKVEGADLMRWDALRAISEGDDAGPRSAMAKLLASEACWETGRAALTAFGGWGLASEMHIERKVRESMVFVFNNMLWSYVAQRSLGLPKAF
ncbi:MAG: acyl-CoA dehydrogenase [Deltaproteobacteria bacterium]|nr:MAG: acyl-CoA dehydrogenase [Deltaproteobacteria bacterium]